MGLQHQRAARTRALNRFERAVEHKAFKGSYPVFSEDPEEQEELDAIHLQIDTEYEKARRSLWMLLNGL